MVYSKRTIGDTLGVWWFGTERESYEENKAEYRRNRVNNPINHSILEWIKVLIGYGQECETFYCSSWYSA
jgi:hypothetical protein